MAHIIIMKKNTKETTPLLTHVQTNPCNIIGKLNNNVYKWYFFLSVNNHQQVEHKILLY